MHPAGERSPMPRRADGGVFLGTPCGVSADLAFPQSAHPCNVNVRDYDFLCRGPLNDARSIRIEGHRPPVILWRRIVCHRDSDKILEGASSKLRNADIPEPGTL